MPRREYRGPVFWHERRVALFAEQGGGCPWCLKALTNQDEVAVHHRRRRLGRDEDDDLVNLLLLHGWCHRQVHSWVTVARECGFIVPSWAEPGDVPKPSVTVGTPPQGRVGH